MGSSFMDSGAPVSSTISAASTRTTSRKHPLHTCAVSFIALGHIVFTKWQGFDGLIGSVMKWVAALARPFAPFIRAIQYVSLALLSFFDKYILAVENLIEIFFPPSALVFDKIDEIIRIVEVIPSKLDDMILHQTPVLDYALALAISWLKNFLSLLTSENTREKEIMIDVNCESLHTESASVDQAGEFAESPKHVKSVNLEMLPLLSDAPQAESGTNESTAKADATNLSFVGEVLEQGKPETVESEGGDIIEEDESKEDDAGEKVSEEKENGASKIAETEEALLELLYEERWHMTPPKRR